MNEVVDNGMKAYVRYRLEKAQEVYQAACILYDAGQWNSVVNRLYYACFYLPIDNNLAERCIRKLTTQRNNVGISFALHLEISKWQYANS